MTYRTSEAEDQAAVIEYCALIHFPAVHIPNEGKRTRSAGAELRRVGMSAGFPDLFFPVPLGEYHGLFIEMKAGKNKPTENQREWISRLSRAGYAVAVCYGFDAAKKVIDEYRRGADDLTPQELAFMVVRNSAVLPAGIRERKTMNEINDMTLDVLDEIKQMINIPAGKKAYREARERRTKNDTVTE